VKGDTLRPEACVLIAAACVPLLLAPPAATSILDAARFGARPGADATVNTRAIQAALDAAGSAGGWTVAVTRPGVYDLAAQGLNPYQHGHRYCLDLHYDGLTLRIGPGVTLRLADGQQADATGPVDVVVWRSRKGLRITGGGTITGNTAGQRGWTRGYGPITNGILLAGYSEPGTGNERIRIEDVTLADHFSNAINISGHPESRDRGIEIVRVRARDTGAGPLVMNADDVTLRDVTYENKTVSPPPGDGLELSNVTGFLIANATVRGMLGGSAIDLYGSRFGTVDGFVIEGGVEGITIQENMALRTYSERVQVRNGTVRLWGAGTGVVTKGARVRGVTLSAVKVFGGSIPGTIGFHISAHNVAERLSRDWRQEGPVTLENCEAHGLHVGLLIKTVANASVIGGDYSGNTASPQSDGILWMGQANATSREDTRGLVIRGVKATGNRRYGLHIHDQGFIGREPEGFLTHCSLGGNGAGGYQLTREAAHEFPLYIDDSCASAAAPPSSAPSLPVGGPSPPVAAPSPP